MQASRDIAVPRERVWDVLSDGWLYANWVVGASRIRAVDENWPADGARICHSVGTWPLVVNDQTVSVRSVPPEELVLHARVFPAGAARITLRLTEIPGGCRVEMDEQAISGPPKLLPKAVQDVLFAPRNRECLWRLANIAEQRQPSEIG
jgi:uncharacterized protein YndB with AHSA1/START domain